IELVRKLTPLPHQLLEVYYFVQVSRFSPAKILIRNGLTLKILIRFGLLDWIERARRKKPRCGTGAFLISTFKDSKPKVINRHIIFLFVCGTYALQGLDRNFVEIPGSTRRDSSEPRA